VAIINAMRQLILEKGYAETSITDLAKRSRISVSHFLYYFPTKEAVLEEVCKELLTTVQGFVDSHRGDSPEQRIEHLVGLIFPKEALPRPEFGFFVEILALSMHYPRVRKLFDEYSLGINAYLIDLFRKVPRTAGRSAEDAATIAAALWGGLLHNAMFDKRLREQRARALFRGMLLDLAGIGTKREVKGARSTIHRTAGTSGAATSHS